ncbi:PQ-loop repeat-containing protein [Aspergillus undulatus]|uniref:PQ-loop repeat-containing protein n=1 Tax=Aspergillus undulatus TaxID=1810928 RepID=UPI003CCCF5D3
MVLVSIQSILLALTFISFTPQLRLLWARQNCSGISLIYVLINLISATEHFTINFVFLVIPGHKGDVFINDPISVEDWLNLCQNMLVWILFIIYFAMCLWFPSDCSTENKRLAVGIYMAFLFISVVPSVSYAIILAQDNDDAYDGWLSGILLNLHKSYVSYAVSWLMFVAAYAQDIAVLNQSPQSSCTSLSLVGLAVQAVVFPLVAISWIYRVPYPYIATPPEDFLGYWYETVGWAVVDNAVFGIGQANILRLGFRQRTKSGLRTSDEEREPLLRNEV